MDGWITIGTKLDNSKFEQQVKKLTNRLKEQELNLEVTYNEKQDAEKEMRDVSALVSKARKEQQEHLAILEKKKAQYEEINNLINKGEALTPEQYNKMGILNNDISKLNSEQNELNLTFDNYNSKLNKSVDNLDRIEKKYEKQKNKVNELKEEIQSLVNTESKRNFENISKSINQIGQSISGVIKKVGKWALAVFSIRSAYMLVRQAMSTLTQYNEELANKISNIKLVLAVALEPIVLKIVSLVEMLLRYINHLTKAWFGIDLFARASELSAKGMANGMADTTKSAKELKKTLAGFDEMEILQDNNNENIGGGGGTSGIGDGLSELGEIELPTINLQKWLKKIKKMIDDFLKNMKKVISDWFKKIGFSKEFIAYWELGIDGVKSLFDGFLDFINGILEIIVGIFSGDTKKIKKGFQDAFKGIIEIVKGAFQVIGGVFGMIKQAVIDTFKKIPELIYNLFFSKTGKDFDTFKNDVKTKFDEIFNKIKSVFEGIPNIIKSIFDPNTYISAWNNFKNSWNNFINGLTKNIKITYSAEGGGTGSWGGGSGGGGFRAKGGIYYPKLASGGIINMPGRGVPYHGATIGERGAEAVVPLTDSQQMALLGEAIGKYITVNATIVNSMNGRVLNRELQKIQNQTNFATNGRW